MSTLEEATRDWWTNPAFRNAYLDLIRAEAVAEYRKALATWAVENHRALLDSHGRERNAVYLIDLLKRLNVATDDAIEQNTPPVAPDECIIPDHDHGRGDGACELTS
jgi:hypothetical protein